MTIMASMLPMAAVLLASERRLNHLPFAISACGVVFAALLLCLADVERAALFTALLCAAIVGASMVKYHHSGIKLTVADFALVFAGTIPFLWAQYRRTATLVLFAMGAFALSSLWIGQLHTDEPLSLDVRVGILALSLAVCALIYRTMGGAVSFRASAREQNRYLSTFAASLIDVASWRPSRGLILSDIARDPLPLMDATPARTTDRPDIIFIQHESVFDPRIYGLAIEPDLERFFSPGNGISGALNVDIYGGGSWQSEFSLLTGLSSATFGPDAYFIFRRGVDRFRHSLPRSLAKLGYQTLLASSCRRSFMEYDAFYRSIGMGERLFSDDLSAPFDVNAFEKTYSDAAFLPQVVAELTDRLALNQAPHFLYALTNSNHGPHTRRHVDDPVFSGARAFANEQLKDEQYGEYYSRLTETASSWQRVKAELAARFPDRPMLVVHYGDHQPVMTRRIQHHQKSADDAQRQFRTFYAIEGINFVIDPAAVAQAHVPQGSTLDIAFLGTLALQIAGLPLDRVTTTRASLLKECREGYFAARSVRKHRFHRTLVSLRLIDVAPVS
jgi:Sulfatase